MSILFVVSMIGIGQYSPMQSKTASASMASSSIRYQLSAIGRQLDEQIHRALTGLAQESGCSSKAVHLRDESVLPQAHDSHASGASYELDPQLPGRGDQVL